MKSLTIEICSGLSCHLLGARDLIESIENLPSSDREQIKLSEVSCLNSCGKGPNVKINGILFPGMTPRRLLNEIERYLGRKKITVAYATGGTDNSAHHCKKG